MNNTFVDSISVSIRRLAVTLRSSYMPLFNYSVNCVFFSGDASIWR